MPNKQKLSAEKKIQIVREYLRARISITEAARRVGTDRETIKGWINIYENEGANGFIHKEQRTYSIELKTAAVIDYQRGGGSLQTICRKYGIRDKHILRRWIKVYNAHAICPIFKFSAEVRTVIYTTNAIESLNATYRKLNRQRSVFPSDQALLKALYLSTFEATKKWTMPLRNWGRIYGELQIMYEGRLPE